MNKYINIFICFITGIIIYLLIENTFKVNSIEGFDLLSILGITKEEEVTLLQLLQTNLQLDELINLFKSNRADCIGEFRPTECDKKCGFGVRDSIYTITQQKGDKGMPCPYKDGHIKQERCINKTCGDDKLCFKNEDCKSLNCDKVTMKCQSLFDCDRGDFIDNCNTKDKCMSLNEKYPDDGLKYTWDGEECYSESVPLPLPLPLPLPEEEAEAKEACKLCKMNMDECNYVGLSKRWKNYSSWSKNTTNTSPNIGNLDPCITKGITGKCSNSIFYLPHLFSKGKGKRYIKCGTSTGGKCTGYNSQFTDVCNPDN